jgi:rhamnogalacturonyl hydrolase YesR
MITFAILRGLKYGWLDTPTYEPVAQRAWEALKVRIGPDGVLFDVCTGTGKQQTLRDYLDREAILGQDERGGAMALMVTVEMADWMARK